MRAFDIIDHTADIGLIVRGKTLEELFANAALGMFSIIGDVSRVSPRESRPVHVRAEDRGLLLAEFLDELLYLLDAEHFVVHHAEVESVSGTEARAVIHGEPVSPAHDLHTDIKAVTHHALSVEKRGKIWEATVLFDV